MIESADEMMKFLRLRNISDFRESVIDAAFRLKPKLRKLRFRTRFSDGTFSVFYGALEPDTASAEIAYWFRRSIGNPREPRTGYYLRFACDFSGMIKDLREKKRDWPDLRTVTASATNWERKR